MYLKLLLLSCVYLSSHSVFCYEAYIWANAKPWHYLHNEKKIQDGYINIRDSRITPKVIQEDLIGMEIINRDQEGTDNIELVADFPNLRNINIQIKLDFIPIFKNLPSLESLVLTKNNFISVKVESFSELPVKSVLLSFNQILSIEKHSFGDQVDFVELVCNNLTSFNINWFKNISKLNRINLSGNFLKRIQQDIFKTANNLQFIDFGFNNIASIGKGAFGHKKIIKSLNLNDNHLKQLNANIFDDDIVEINELQINKNNLTFLSKELLDNLIISKKISLGDNPWQCECWFQIKKWLPDDTKIERVQDRPICVVSNFFTKYCVPLIDTEIIDHYNLNLNLYEMDEKPYCQERALKLSYEQYFYQARTFANNTKILFYSESPGERKIKLTLNQFIKHF